MSDAALTIWISCGSLLISAASLVVSIAAYRRSETLRRLDRLSELSRDIANLRPRLDQLERTIPKAVQSRAPASAALGHGLRDCADAAPVRAPKGQPDGGTVPRAVQSGAPAPAAPDHGLRAGADAAAVRAPGGQLDGGTIPKAVQSRAPASAAQGHGYRAGADAAAVRAPRGQLDGAASIPKRVDHAGIETESLTARQVSTRLEQLVHYMRERAGRPK
jgi:hypothetical protein